MVEDMRKKEKKQTSEVIQTKTREWAQTAQLKEEK